MLKNANHSSITPSLTHIGPNGPDVYPNYGSDSECLGRGSRGGGEGVGRGGGGGEGGGRRASNALWKVKSAREGRGGGGQGGK